jgi:hypothetical protein
MVKKTNMVTIELIYFDSNGMIPVKEKIICPACGSDGFTIIHRKFKKLSMELGKWFK